MKNMQTEFKWALITNKQKIQQKQQRLAVSTWPIDWVVELIGNGKLTNWQIATTTKPKKKRNIRNKFNFNNIRKERKKKNIFVWEKSVVYWSVASILNISFSAFCYCILFNWFLLLYNQVVAEFFWCFFFFLPGNKCICLTSTFHLQRRLPVCRSCVLVIAQVQCHAHRPPPWPSRQQTLVQHQRERKTVTFPFY